MFKNTIYLVLSAFVLAGCIEPYHAKTGKIDPILVVEGIITEGTTQITLSQSTGIDDDVSGDMLAVHQAAMCIECDDGTNSDMVYSGPSIYGWVGTYTIATGKLNPNAKYRLAIYLDGEEYRSSFLPPAISPPVDVSVKSDDYNIYLCVSTYGNDRQPGYYLWSYGEDWEVHSVMHADSVLINGKMVKNDLTSANNRYYCWRQFNSTYLILGTTEKLIENTIREKMIHSFSRSDDRISVLYRISVKQNTIHKEAYDFFYNLKRNTEQSGSIFGPIPSELRGNIRCTSNLDIPVIGYVDVSTVSTNELYLSNEYYKPSLSTYQSCENALDTISPNSIPPKVIQPGYVFYKFFNGGKLGERQFIYMPGRCADCTKIGGSKRKPEDWPNNHQ